jgi:flavin-binding protein dodecin
VTPRQRTALRHACQRAEETTHPRFFEVRHVRGLVLASILTVNR